MLVSGAVFGAVAGFAVGRSWRPLLTAQVRWLPFLIGSLVIRVLATFFGEAGYPVYVAALAGTTVVAAANYKLTGAAVIALGSCINTVVVLVNHGMPVDVGALAVVGAGMPHDALHVALDANTRLAFLADVIPVAIVRSVYSVGDICIAFGGFLVPFALLARR
jgi:hypothetical protein